MLATIALIRCFTHMNTDAFTRVSSTSKTSQCVCIPRLFTCCGDLCVGVGNWTDVAGRLARENKVWLVIGMTEHADGALYDTAVLIDST